MNDSESASRINELENDNRRLRRLLEERHAPAELRHRLRSTLTLMRAIIRNSARTVGDVQSYAAHIEDRLDALASAQTMADETGAIEIGSVLAEAVRRYGGSEGRNLTMSGPIVFLQPRPGQVFALAAHELALNALSHGALGINDGHVSVDWQVAEDSGRRKLQFVWKERGGRRHESVSKPGFGMDVLNQLVAYELRATVEWRLDADGARYTIEVPLDERIGRSEN